MTIPSPLLQALALLSLSLVLALACLTDLRERRIPNRLVLAGLVAGALWHLMAPAGDGWWSATRPGGSGLAGWAAGTLVVGLAFFPAWLAGWIGAGDVKLAAVAGGFAGWSGSAAALALVAAILLAGGVLGVTRAALSNAWRVVGTNLRTIGRGVFARLSGSPGPAFDPVRDSADRMPYALAIAAGTALFALLARRGGAA